MPHAARLLVGADHRRLLPLATIGGAGFLLLADLLARTIIAPEERFSLSTAEAFAAGLPAAMNARSAVDLGDKLIEIVSEPEVRDRVSARGREIAEQWRAANVAARLEEHFATLER